MKALPSPAPSTLQSRLESHQITILGRQSKTNQASPGDQPTSSQGSSSKQPPPPKHTDGEITATHAPSIESMRQTSATSLPTNSLTSLLSYTGTQPVPSDLAEGASYYSEFEGMVQGAKNMPKSKEDGETISSPDSTATVSLIPIYN